MKKMLILNHFFQKDTDDRVEGRKNMKDNRTGNSKVHLDNLSAIPNCRSLTVKEVAQHLGISMPTAYKLINEPDFPVFKVGKIYRIREDLLNEWMLRQSEGGQ